MSPTHETVVDLAETRSGQQCRWDQNDGEACWALVKATSYTIDANGGTRFETMPETTMANLRDWCSAPLGPDVELVKGADIV